MEKLRIAERISGWDLDKEGRSYWNKLVILWKAIELAVFIEMVVKLQSDGRNDRKTRYGQDCSCVWSSSGISLNK